MATNDQIVKRLGKLQSTLLTSGLQQSNQPLYQVINQLIQAVIDSSVGVVEQIGGGSGGGPVADQTFITTGNDLATLPNSSQLIAGDHVSFDTSIFGQLRIDILLDFIIEAFILTSADESSNFPNSRQLLAGTNVSFDDSVPNERTINASAGSGGITELTGDVTAGPGTGSQAATIAANAVTNTKLRDSGALSVIGRSANSSGDPADISAVAASGSVLRESGSTLGFGTIATVGIADKAVTYAKIQDISATDRLLGRDSGGSGVTEEIPVTSGLEFTGGPGLRVTEAVRTETIGITVDGAGAVLTTGAKGFKSFMKAGTITRWRILNDAAGNIQFDVKKSTYSAFPTQSSIVASAPPVTSGVQKNEDTTLTGWTTSVSAGDVFGFEITGTPATVTRATLELTIVVT